MTDSVAAAAAGRVIRPAVPAVTTPEQLDDVVSAYMNVEEFVIDVETWGDHRIDPRRNAVLWVGLATEGRADIIPMGHPNGALREIKRGLLGSGVQRLADGKDLRKSDVSKAAGRERKVFCDPPEQLRPAEVFDALRPVLFSERRKVGAHVKFDLESVSKYYGGEVPPPLYGDVIVADFLLDDTHQHQMGLAHICKRRLGYDMPKGVGAKIENFTFDEVAAYLHGDVRFTWLLWKRLVPMIAKSGLSGVLRLEMDLLECLMAMEQTGVRIDTDALHTLRDELEEGSTRAKADAYRAAGRVFNVKSLPEKRELLFGAEGRNLTPTEFTGKTGEPAVTKTVLQHHRKDPLAKALLSISELDKLTSTYVDPYLGTKDKPSLLVGGRVHTSFKQHGARAGRLSSSQPNLQNIPARGSYGKRIREAFVADTEYVLCDADYGQIEPRMMASLSGDKTMLEAFLNDEDIYTAIADPLGVNRQAGKVLILSMAYGVGPGKVAEDLGITVKAARDLLDEFARKFPTLTSYKRYIVRKAESRRPMPFTSTILGRRRLLPELRSSDEGLRAYGRRVAFNARIQGSSAEVMKIALVRVHQMLPEGSKALLTVHDEILVASPVSQVEETRSAVREAMEGVSLPQIKVPLKADVGVGRTWAEAKGA